MYHHVRVVLDTNVVVAAALSRRGASSKLLGLLAEDRFEIALTLPLYLEYEDVLQRDRILSRGIDPEAARELCEDLGAVAKAQVVHFVWRPWLRDPDDDMVLEAAVASGSRYIVTFNLKDFRGHGVERAFGIDVVTPAAMISLIEEEAK